MSEIVPCEYGSAARWQPDSIRLDPPLVMTWTPAPGEEFIGSPVLGHGLAFCVSRQRGLLAIEASSGDVRWHAATERGWGACLLMDDAIVSTPRPGALVVLDAVTGTERASYAIEAMLLSYGVALDNQIVAPCDDGSVAAWDCGRGEFAWRVETAWSASPISVGSGLVCFTESSACVALDFATGAQRWRVDVSDLGRHNTIIWGDRAGEIASVPIIGRNAVYAGLSDGSVVALGLQNGRQLWRTKIAETPAHNITLTPDGELLALSSDTLLTLSGETGAVRARHALTGPDGNADDGPFAPMALSARYVWSADRRGRLEAISRQDGQVEWRTDLHTRIGSPPAIADGRLFVVGIEGRLFAFTMPG